MEFLEESFPDHWPRLFPRDSPYEKARMKIWMDFVTSRIIPAFHRFLQFKGEKMEKAREEFLGHLKQWTEAMDPTGPFFAGKEISMPDLVLAPWSVRLWCFDHFKEGGLGMPEPGKGGEDEEVWGRWRKWVSAVEGLKSVKETTSNREHFLQIYKR
jgi:glutathione S-transferase